MNYLIIGGTGSLGKAIVNRLLKTNDCTIRIYSRHEQSQVEMQRELNDSRLRFLIGDVRDDKRLKRAMEGVDYVIDCAALKHVPVCEYNPIEAVRTNIDGSINVIDAAIDCGVKKLIYISSDKAVYPINIYGATKSVAEKLFIHSNIYGKDRTYFSCIRFGNFYGSSGSVIELWQKQKETGTITITDRSMKRYFIKLDKASEFVVDCLDKMRGGEIFIPEMQEEWIKDKAREIAPLCKLEIIGRRGDEKLREELWTEVEEPRIEKQEGYYVIK